VDKTFEPEMLHGQSKPLMTSVLPGFH